MTTSERDRKAFYKISESLATISEFFALWMICKLVMAIAGFVQ